MITNRLECPQTNHFQNFISDLALITCYITISSGFTSNQSELLPQRTPSNCRHTTLAAATTTSGDTPSPNPDRQLSHTPSVSAKTFCKQRPTRRHAVSPVAKTVNLLILAAVLSIAYPSSGSTPPVDYPKLTAPQCPVTSE